MSGSTARCCESRLREAAHFEALYPGEFEDFGGSRRSAAFWSGLAFSAANTLQRLKQQPKVG
ncbi:MAG TPA: hypothetical protein VHN11_01545 [Xanthobacteraceae bacterium]|jgi:hypothetical protein|nr:hypothetical protein [Xanthobacteraceae bacterium]